MQSSPTLLPGASKPGRDREGTDRRKCPVPLHTDPEYRPHGLRSEDRLHDSPPRPRPACWQRRCAGRWQSSRGVRGQLRPEPPPHLRLWRRPRPEPPHRLQWAAQGPEVTHFFSLNNCVCLFTLAMPSLHYRGGFSPAVGHGLLLAAASPAAETGSGRHGRQELRLRALPARQSRCAALAAQACTGLWELPGLDLSPALAGRFFTAESCLRSHASDICQLCWGPRTVEASRDRTPERPSRSSYPRGS